MAIVLGVDVGQAQDYTACVVVEARDEQFVVRAGERLPLGTPYPEILARLLGILQSVQRYRLPQEAVVMRIDCTGVGKPVFDHIEQEMRRQPHPPAVVQGIVFREGDRPPSRREDGLIVVGKGVLVARLRALLAAGRIRMGTGPMYDQLRQELLTYEWRIRERRETGPSLEFGAFQRGTHDDMVTALALAVLYDIRDIRSAKEVAPSSSSVRRPRFLQPDMRL